MFYLLEFECDNSIDIVDAASLMIDNEEAEIGERVLAMYKIGKKKNWYEARVLNKSEDFVELNKEMEKNISESKEKERELELGRGKRVKRKLEPFSGEQTSDEETIKPKMKVISQKTYKLEQSKQTAKELMKRINQEQVPSSSQKEEGLINSLRKENTDLKKEISKLKMENRRLRKERSDALEISRLLSTANSLVDSLGKIDRLNFKAIDQPPKMPLEAPVTDFPQSQRPPIWDGPSTSVSLPSVGPETSVEALCPEEIEEHDFSKDMKPIMQTVHGHVMHDITPASPQLLYSGIEDNVVRLVDEHEVYVLKTAKEGLTQFSKNQTTVVRSGLVSIFTKEALLSCSVKGGLAKGSLGRREEQRPSLFPTAVAALIEFSKQVAKKKGWNALPERDLVCAMGTKLSELRAKERKKIN